MGNFLKTKNSLKTNIILRSIKLEWLLLLLIWLWTTHLSAQTFNSNTPIERKPNFVFYTTFGTNIPRALGLGASLNFESSLAKGDKFQMYFKATYGITKNANLFTKNPIGSKHYSIGLNLLFGKRDSRLEVQLGIGGLDDFPYPGKPDIEKRAIITGGIGYRWQKDYTIAKISINYPEIFHAGIGVAF